MKLPTPAQGSLFAILARAPFWVSLLIAGALFFVMRSFLPDLLAAATTLPFLGTAAFAGWRQIKTPSPTRVGETLDCLREMSWPAFATVIAQTFRGEGYEVGPLENGAANYALSKTGYTTLVSCKRWKVAQTGIVPLRELHDALEARGARDCVYVTIGTFTDSALAFAREKQIRLLHGADLAQRAGPLLKAAARG